MEASESIVQCREMAADSVDVGTSDLNELAKELGAEQGRAIGMRMCWQERSRSYPQMDSVYVTVYLSESEQKPNSTPHLTSVNGRIPVIRALEYFNRLKISSFGNDLRKGEVVFTPREAGLLDF